MKHRLISDTIFFGVGGFGYGLMEVIARGHTHPTMLFAGGICLLIMTKIATREKTNFFVKCFLCAAVITAVEFVFGYIFNIVLKMEVWDYSNKPYNILGQICPQFFLIWLLVSAAVIITKSFFTKKHNTD